MTEDFQQNESVTIVRYPYDYRRAFSESALLVTDYSSVAFDFAYLRKPVLYTQFDSDTFFDKHSYTKGYFNYEQDGFGLVCDDYDSSVRAIVNAIEKGPSLNAEYHSRIESFFAFDDTCNSKRVYEAILRS